MFLHMSLNLANTYLDEGLEAYPSQGGARQPADPQRLSGCTVRSSCHRRRSLSRGRRKWRRRSVHGLSLQGPGRGTVWEGPGADRPEGRRPDRDQVRGPLLLRQALSTGFRASPCGVDWGGPARVWMAPRAGCLEGISLGSQAFWVRSGSVCGKKASSLSTKEALGRG